MSTQLSAQLQRLRVREGEERHLAISFLFDKTDARSFSREQILQLAAAGLQTLVAMDNRFHPFIDALFSPHQTRQERQTRSAEENRRLDLRVEHLLTLLSPHLFLTAAQQVFEYLVRVHEVHVYNVAAVLRAFLPYHDHNIFARALLLLDLRDTGFEFLRANQETGTPLPRETLVVACADSRAALRLLCLTAAMPLRLRVRHHAALALFTSVAAALATHRHAEAHWRVLLPFVLECLSGHPASAAAATEGATGAAGGDAAAAALNDNHTELFLGDDGPRGGSGSGAGAEDQEAVCAALLVLSLWSSEVRFTPASLAAVMRPVTGFLAAAAAASARDPLVASTSQLSAAAAAQPPLPLPELLSVVELLFQRQQRPVRSPAFAGALLPLLELPWGRWAGELADYFEALQAATGGSSGSGSTAEPPLRCLLGTLVDYCVGRVRVAQDTRSVPPQVLDFLHAAATVLPVGAAALDAIIRVCIIKQDEQERAAAAADNNENEETEGLEGKEGSDRSAGGAALTELLQAVERRGQGVFDASLAALLQSPDTREAAAGHLRRHLGGTRYQMLSVPARAAAAAASANGSVVVPNTAATSVQLPLFACLLHTLPEVRVLAADALRGLSLAQLTAVSAGGAAGSSLLELLAHVVAGESDATAARALIVTAQGVVEALLRQQQQQHSGSSKATAKGNKKSAGNDTDALPEEQCAAYVGSLLRALNTMAANVPAVADAYAALLLTACDLCRTHSPSSSSSSSSKNAPAPTLGAVESCVLYHAALLYLASFPSAADTTRTATGSSSAEAANALASARESLAAALRARFPSLESRPGDIFDFPSAGASSSSSSPSSGNNGKHQRSSKNKKQKDSSSDDDDDDATQKKEGANGKSSVTHLTVLSDAAVAAVVAREATDAHLASLEERLLSLLRDTAAGAEQTLSAASELALVVAARLRTAPTAATVARLHAFVVRRYLPALAEQQREAARQAAAAGEARAVGRGATNALLHRAFLPRSAVTARLAAAVTAALAPAGLSGGAATAPSPAVMSQALLLLGCLGASLPPLTAASAGPAAAAASLLALLDSDAAAETAEAFGIDWAALVSNAFYAPTAGGQNSNSSATEKASKKSSTPAAVAAVVLLPLQLPAGPLRARAAHTLQKLLQPEPSILSPALLSSPAHAVCAAATTDRAVLLEVAAALAAAASEEGASEHSPLSSAAVEFICGALAMTVGPDSTRVVPFRMAARVMQHFFPDLSTCDTGSSSHLAASGPLPAVAPLLPTLEAILASPRPPAHAAAFVEAVCARTAITAGGSGASASASAAGSGAAHQHPAVRLCAALLRHPFLPLDAADVAAVGSAGSTRPVYRHALRMLAVALSAGSAETREAAGAAAPLIFTSKKSSGNAARRSQQQQQEGEERQNSEEFLAAVAAELTPALVAGITQIGGDVARFIMRTRGGYFRVFLPLLAQGAQQPAAAKGGSKKGSKKAKGSTRAAAAEEEEEPTAAESSGASLEDLVELLEVLLPEDASADDAPARWQPPLSTVVQQPLRQADAAALLALLAARVPRTADGAGLARTPLAGQCLRLLTVLLRVAPALLFDEDSDDENEESGGGRQSLLTLAETILAQYPLDGMQALLQPPSASLASSAYAGATMELITVGGDEAAGVAAGDRQPQLQHRFLHRDARQVLSYLAAFTSLCRNHPMALSAGDPAGASRLRGTLLKQSLTAMASLLLQAPRGTHEEDDNDNDEEDANDEEESHAAAVAGGILGGEAEQEALSRQKIDIIAELLRSMAPLLSGGSGGGSGGGRRHRESGDDDDGYAVGEEGDGSFLLHIPLVALLVRLEAVELTEALRFRSAADVCRDILSGFDVRTQMACVTHLAALLMDPEGQLRPPTDDRKTAHAGNNNEEEDDEDNKKHHHHHHSGSAAHRAQVMHLFRRMIKPNQVINRQETILNIIAATVKADTFLGPFIALQHRSRRTRPNKGRQGTGAGDDIEGSDDDNNNNNNIENEAEKEKEKAELQQGGGGSVDVQCRALLVSCLQLFSHYSSLNEATPNDVAETAVAATAGAGGGAEEAEVLYGERKAYTMVLELLAGNTLACVLAGINESTFVRCLQQLLADRHAALQLKGLEVLLDRLHHSLPTIENTLTPAEVEQRRRDMRDPRKRLTLEDLVRVKARPLTTKRTFALYTPLTRLLDASLETVLAALRAAAPADTNHSSAETGGQSSVAVALPLPALAQLFSMAQLSVACVEELVRIVACGGSAQAERTLLNASRAKRVTEATLNKLFGKKANVTAVHRWVEHLCAQLLPELTQGLHSLNRRPPAAKPASPAPGPSATVVVEAGAFRMAAEEGLLSVMSGVMTALGTVTQTLGAAFAATHCNSLLHALTATSVYAVVELPPLVASRAAGSLLRHTALSSLIRCFPACWQMSQPYLSRMLFVATHWTNVNDGETHYLCSEVLAVLEALMEPQLFLEAATACLQGIPYVNTAVVVGANMQQAALAAAREDAAAAAAGAAAGAGGRHCRTIAVQVSTHSYAAFFQSVQSRVQSLSKDELAGIAYLMEGTSASENVWLAALGTLAAHPTLPPYETAVAPALAAFTAFMLKFKQKHCVRLLRMVALWCFGGDAAVFTKTIGGGGGGGGKERRAEEAIPRTTLHTWVLFYDLACHLFETLGPIGDFALPVVTPYLVSTLHTYCDSARPGSRPLASLLARVLEGALRCAALMCKAQTPGPGDDYTAFSEPYFAEPEVFSSLMPALVRQMDNLAYLSDGQHDYSYRAEHFAAPAVRALMRALEPKQREQAKTQTELLRGLRSPSRHVRRATLALLDGIYADGGEEMASRLMAEMLPPVVELTEDRDDRVVEAARTLCVNLSNMTGQDVLHAMS